MGKYSQDALPIADPNSVCMLCEEGKRCEKFSFHSSELLHEDINGITRFSGQSDILGHLNDEIILGDGEIKGGVHVFDIEANGLVDILTSVYSEDDASNIVWYKNMGNGTFSERKIQFPHTDEILQVIAVSSHEIEDDLVNITVGARASGSSSLNISVVTLKAGAFRSQSTVACDIDSYHNDNGMAVIQVGDIDDDGHNDLVVAQNGSIALYQTKNKIDCKSNAPIVLTCVNGATLNGSVTGFQDVIIADRNNDGSMDIVFAYTYALGGHQYQAIATYLSSEAGKWSLHHIEESVLNGDSNVSKILAADFNGDGHSDLAVATGRGLGVYLGSSSSKVIVNDVLSNMRRPLFATSTDIDLDGHTDILAIFDNITYAVVQWFKFDANGQIQLSSLSTIFKFLIPTSRFLPLSSIAVGDFTNDTWPDVLSISKETMYWHKNLGKSNLKPIRDCWDRNDIGNPETPLPESAYCPAGSQSARPVPAGFYSNLSENRARRSSIIECPKGHFCINGIIKPCQQGHYRNMTGANECAMCPPGQFANVTGLHNCFPCRRGFQCPRGAIHEVKCGCEANRSVAMNNLSTVVLPIINIQLFNQSECGYEGKRNANAKEQISAEEPAGKIFQAQLTINKCQTIPPGLRLNKNSIDKYNVTVSHTDRGPYIKITTCGNVSETVCNGQPLASALSGECYNNNVSSCPGRVEHTSWRLIMEECPPGFSASPFPGDAFCPAQSGTPTYATKGTFTVGNSGPFIATNVPSGKDRGVVSYGGGMMRFGYEKCPPGEACKSGRNYTCPEGFNATGYGNFICQACAPGYFAEIPKTGVCAQCPTGWYQNLPQKTECEKCQYGRYAQYRNQILCNTCPAGWFADDLKFDYCKRCPKGKFATGNGTRYCTHCKPGKDSAGKTGLAGECTNCRSGRFRPNGFLNGGVFGEGFEVCEKCTSSSYGCGHYIAGFINTAKFKAFTWKLANRVDDGYEYCKDEFSLGNIESPNCVPFSSNNNLSLSDPKVYQYIKFVGSGGTVLRQAKNFEIGAKPLGQHCGKNPTEDDLCDMEEGISWINSGKFYDYHLNLKNLDFDDMIETLENGDDYFTGVNCFSNNATGVGQCSECPRGFQPSPDASRCDDTAGIGQKLEKMVSKNEWMIKSYFAGINGDSHKLLVELKIPRRMETSHYEYRNKAQRNVVAQYAVEVSQGNSFSRAEILEGARGATDVRPYEYRTPQKEEDEGDFIDPYPNHQIVEDMHVFSIPVEIPDTYPGVYERVYYVRAFPVLNIDCNMEGDIETCETEDLDTDSQYFEDSGGNLLSEIYPLRTWVTIGDCSTEQNYLETRDGDDVDAGVNTDNRDTETWRCEACPRGGSCRGADESHWRTMVAKYGYWRARTESDTRAVSNVIRTGKTKYYRCPMPWACLGRANEEFAGRDWQGKNYTAKSDPSIILAEQPDPAILNHNEGCLAGYTGITCGNCYDPSKDTRCTNSTFPDGEVIEKGGTYPFPDITDAWNGTHDFVNDKINREARLGGDNQSKWGCPNWPKHFMKGGSCEPCPPQGTDIDVVVLVFAPVGIFVGGYIVYNLILKPLFKFFMKYKVLMNDVKRTLNMLLDFLQVLNSVGSVLTIEFPSALFGFLNVFGGLISFDLKVIIGVPCLDAGDGIGKYLLAFAMPMGISFLFVLQFAINVCRMKGICPKFCGGRLVVQEAKVVKKSALKRKSLAMIKEMRAGDFSEHKSVAKAKVGTGLGALSEKFGNGVFDKKDPPKVQKGIKEAFWFMRSMVFTVLGFYHVPIISKTFNMFRCELIEGVEYLNMDYNIKCFVSEQHVWGVIYAVAIMLLYVFGFPLSIAIFLYRNRKELNTPRMMQGAGYLHKMFRYDSAWYFRAFAMLRKIILAGALIVLYKSPVMQITIGIIYCSLLLITLQHVRPFKNHVAQGLTTISWLSITLIYMIPLSMLAMKSSPTPGESGQQGMVNLFCEVVLYGTFVLFLLGMVYSMKLTWMKFKIIQGTSNLSADDYAWLYEDEKSLKARLARVNAEKAQDSHALAGKNMVKKWANDFLHWVYVSLMPAFIEKRLEKRRQQRLKTTVAPSSGNNNKSRYGFANTTNKRNLPDHLLKRIAERRERRATMANQSQSTKRSQHQLLRSSSFNNSTPDLSKMSKLGEDKGAKDDPDDIFGIAGLDMGPEKSDIGSIPKRRASLDSPRRRASMDAGQKRGSPLMLAAKNDVQTSAHGGDLITLKPRRHLLARKRFSRLDPLAKEKEKAKTERREDRREERKKTDDERFQVFLAAAVKKGYFKGCEMGSKPYKVKYLKLVRRFDDKYEKHKEEHGGDTSSDSDHDDSLKNEPRVIKIRTSAPIVNAFGKKGEDLRKALLKRQSVMAKATSDTVQEI